MATFFKEKDVVVVAEETRRGGRRRFCEHYPKKVTVVHRRDKLRASQIMQEVPKEPEDKLRRDSS